MSSYYTVPSIFTDSEFSFEVEALRAELSEQTEQLNYLRGRLQEIAISKQEEANAYAKAQHFLEMKENSTRTEVFRLRGSYYYCTVIAHQTKAQTIPR